jgi:hypothetical protein
MRRLALTLLAALAWPVTGCAQDLSGSYRYDGPNGATVMTLSQETPARVTGTMQMANGSTFTIDAQVENGRALGDIIFDGDKGFFAAGFQGANLLVVVAERDPGTGQPRLDAGWNLTFTRVGAVGAPSGAAAPAGGALGPGAAAMLEQGPANAPPGSGTQRAAPNAAAAAAAQPGAAPAGAGGDDFAQTDQSPTAQAWIQKLRGKRITHMDSYNSRSSSGDDGYISGGGYSDRFDAYLCSDGRFLYRTRSRTTIDDGAFGSSASQSGLQGRWRIITQGDQAAIEYRTTEGQQDHVMLGFKDGKTYWDGKRVFVTTDNDVCS